MAYKWIMYVQPEGMPHIPGPTFVTSLSKAREEFEIECRNIGTDECTAALYPYSDEDGESAEEFAGIGIPFDYPSRRIERGPNGGIHVLNT